MRYRTRKLISSYGRETAVMLAQSAARLLARAKGGFDYLDMRLTASWRKSLPGRCCLYAGRAVAQIPPRAYVGLCLAGCGLMSLGFLVVNPPQARLSHRVRIDVNRPTVTALSAGEALRLDQLSAYELAALYQSGTGHDSGWFQAGPLSYAEAEAAAFAPAGAVQGPEADVGGAASRSAEGAPGWQSSRSPLGVKNGQVIMRTSLGPQSIERLGELRLSAQSTERPSRSLKKIAAGTAGPERLLAELSLQGADAALAARLMNAQAEPAPKWGGGAYGTGVFAGPLLHWSGQYLSEAGPAENFCPQERMEQASWLNMLYASHSRNDIYTGRQAWSYRPYVERFASRYSLQPSLVYAIMRVESGFNPLAVSRANALGLMQVVPETAGNEVHAFLRGKKSAPRPEILFTPESNIEYGTAYLHLLITRHFKEVKNPVSREMCVIAAYNGGPSAVYRVFSRDRNRALEQINKLTPEQLYARLLTNLASQETREYLPKVLAARNDFLRGQAKTR